MGDRQVSDSGSSMPERCSYHKAIQERMGHSSITVTLDRYGHLFPSLDERLAEALDEGLRETLASHTRPRAATLSLA